MPLAMDKNYDHKKYEEEIYKMWKSSGAFGSTGRGEPYTILMPPPNANASLHSGHAMYVIDDIVTRWKRMQGYSTVWIPGMDHAGFETQYVYEKELAKTGRSRLDFDRQTLYDNVFQFVKDNSGQIYKQFKSLGFSADWSRSVFTLDPQVLDQVVATFKKMVEEGLVYRDNYIVNYCTHCGTSLAELEVEHEERVDPLYYIKYQLSTQYSVRSAQEYIEVATARPETLFGDTAVAVHPKDKRYKALVGKMVRLPLTSRDIPIIADEMVDIKFGTGAVKITPAHDQNDFEAGKKHKLMTIKVIDEYGRMRLPSDATWAEIEGKKVKEAREMVANRLELEKKDYSHNVTVCYKCKRDLEPTVILNWFIKVEELKKPVIAAVKKDRVRFYPKRFKKAMLDWLTIMHDWPISRQIVWGIRIPVWYDVMENPETQVSTLVEGKKIRGKIGELLTNGLTIEEIGQGLQTISAPKSAKFVVSPTRPGSNYLQETDTFDTWFSSGQWPLVTLSKEEFETRWPTDFMGTLADILKFWVSRMIMFALYVKDEVPFKDVYLWSMVADAKGIKMSKSKGNVINPMTYIEKYGADALRMTMVHGVVAGGQVNLAEEKIRGMRNFANKMWNIARFVQSVRVEEQESVSRTADDEWIMAELKETVGKVNMEMEKYNFGRVAEILYEFIWHEFADIYIEKTKDRKDEASPTLHFVLETSLKLLHPFMPFVTEAVYQELQSSKGAKVQGKLLMTSEWPADNATRSQSGKPKS